MLKFAVLLVLIASLETIEAKAPSKDISSTSGLVEVCSSESIDKVALCAGYILGSIEGRRFQSIKDALLITKDLKRDAKSILKLSEELISYCAPKIPNISKEVNAFIAYVKKHPEKSFEPSVKTIQDTFEELYPCGKKQT